ncbi:MAG: cyclic nucleotide-binding domain-containing protein, partial [Spirochaetaceae bacterium]|nr:cyclic nucleotide-binding domain-containing protein [Spirochaetaceae bacterium]
MTKKKIAKAGVDGLKKVAILSDLTDKELEHILSISKIIEVSSDTIIMTEGEPGSTMYFFVKGEVKVSKNLTLKIGKRGFGSAEKSMVKLKAEHVSFFGDMAMFQDEPRSATITASMDCTLYEITRESFTKFCNDFPQQGVKVLQRIATTMAGRVRKGNEDI